MQILHVEKHSWDILHRVLAGGCLQMRTYRYIQKLQHGATLADTSMRAYQEGLPCRFYYASSKSFSILGMKLKVSMYWSYAMTYIYRSEGCKAPLDFSAGVGSHRSRVQSKFGERTPEHGAAITLAILHACLWCQRGTTNLHCKCPHDDIAQGPHDTCLSWCCPAAAKGDSRSPRSTLVMILLSLPTLC